MAEKLTRDQQREMILIALDGNWLSITSLSDDTGISKYSTAEIIKELAGDGLIIKRAYSGGDQWRRQQEPSVKVGNSKAKMRKCLCCQREFWSEHAGIRLCTRCKTSAERNSAGIFDHHVHILA